MIPVQMPGVCRDMWLRQCFAAVINDTPIQASRGPKQQCQTDGTEIACGADCCKSATQYCKDGQCIPFKLDSAGAISNCINTGHEFCFVSPNGQQFCVHGV
jgi:hypothetical protein